MLLLAFGGGGDMTRRLFTASLLTASFIFAARPFEVTAAQDRVVWISDAQPMRYHTRRDCVVLTLVPKDSIRSIKESTVDSRALCRMCAHNDIHDGE